MRHCWVGAFFLWLTQPGLCSSVRDVAGLSKKPGFYCARCWNSGMEKLPFPSGLQTQPRTGARAPPASPSASGAPLHWLRGATTPPQHWWLRPSCACSVSGVTATPWAGGVWRAGSGWRVGACAAGGRDEGECVRPLGGPPGRHGYRAVRVQGDERGPPRAGGAWGRVREGLVPASSEREPGSAGGAASGEPRPREGPPPPRERLPPAGRCACALAPAAGRVRETLPGQRLSGRARREGSCSNPLAGFILRGEHEGLELACTPVIVFFIVGLLLDFFSKSEVIVKRSLCLWPAVLIFFLWVKRKFSVKNTSVDLHPKKGKGALWQRLGYLDSTCWCFSDGMGGKKSWQRAVKQSRGLDLTPKL